MDCITVLPGVRRGTACFFYNDFKLHKNTSLSKRHGVIAHLECLEHNASGKCPYELIVEGDNVAAVDAIYVEIGVHNHVKKEHEYVRLKFRRTFEKRAMENPNEEKADLYDRVLSELGFNVYHVESKTFIVKALKKKNARLSRSDDLLMQGRHEEVTIPPRRVMTSASVDIVEGGRDVAEVVEEPVPAAEIIGRDELQRDVAPVATNKLDCTSTTYRAAGLKDRLNFWNEHLQEQMRERRFELDLLVKEEDSLHKLDGSHACTPCVDIVPPQIEKDVNEDVVSILAEVDLIVAGDHTDSPIPIEGERSAVLEPRQCIKCNVQPACVLIVGCGNICLCGLCAMLIESISSKTCPCCGKLGKLDSFGSLLFQVVY